MVNSKHREGYGAERRAWGISDWGRKIVIGEARIDLREGTKLMGIPVF
jgi:hypothetical protein